MLDHALFSHFCQSLLTLQRGLAEIADLLVRLQWCGPLFVNVTYTAAQCQCHCLVSHVLHEPLYD